MPSLSSFLHNRSLLLILGAAIVVRIGAAFVFDPPMISDDRDYHAIAVSLLHGDGFSLEGSLTAYRLPGYPMFLAAIYAVCGAISLPVRLVQGLLDVLTCFMVFLLGRRIAGDRTAKVGAAVYSVFPLSVLYGTTHMSETVFTALLLLFLVLLPLRPEQRGRLVGAGCVAGIAVLFRTTALVLPLAAAFIPALAGRPALVRMRPVLLTAGIMSLVILPWLLRNEAVFDRFALTSNSGVNFWMGNHHGASGSYSFPSGNPLESVASEFERSDLGFRLGLEFWKDEPLQALFVAGKKFAHLFSIDYWMVMVQRATTDWRPPPRALDMFRGLPAEWLGAVHFPFVAVVLFAMPGFFLLPHERRPDWSAVWLICLLWILSHLVIYGGARYRVPLHPLLILAAAQGWELITQRTAVVTRTRIAAMTAVALLLLAGWGTEAWLLFLDGGL